MTQDEKATQVSEQCRVVAKLATEIAGLHADYAKIFRDHPESMETITEMVGKRSAWLMEELGDILNGMDAVAEEDEWMEPIFRKAQKLWPVDRNVK